MREQLEIPVELDGERIERAAAAAMMSLDAQENIEKDALEALSSL